MSRWSTKRIFSVGIVGVFLVWIFHLVVNHFDFIIRIETFISADSQLAMTENQTRMRHTGIQLDLTPNLKEIVPTRGKLRLSVPKPLETNVFKWKEGKWQRIPNFCYQARKFNSAILKTPVGRMKMYIHDIRDDIHVSGAIMRSGIWEQGLVKTMVDWLKHNPNMGVIDLGAQLGQYSLIAGLAGHPVVAVDPLVENVLRFCRSIQEAKLTTRITILFTALSDTYRTVTFKREPGNIGGTHIKSAGSAKYNDSDNFNPNSISTVKLDDILKFVNFSKAFMKIDVESHEYNVLKEGRKLFDSIDVRAVMMEWFQLKTSSDGLKLKQFLTNRTYYAVEPYKGRVLNPTRSHAWPGNILWLKST